MLSCGSTGSRLQQKKTRSAAGLWRRSRFPINSGSRLLVDNDAPPSKRGRVGEVDVLGHEGSVVVDERTTLIDFDPEPVDSVAARLIAVVRDQHEPIARHPVDGAVASVCRLPAAGDDQAPGVLHGAVEVDVSRLELEFGLAFRNIGALLVLRDETEVCLAR